MGATKGITTYVAEDMGLLKFENLQDSISYVLNNGPEDLKITVLREGPNILPLEEK
ncbi:MAG: hypothetical protein IMZ52_10510 [Actinobacteria bacterium]|nr:hypothetical protein [Actinomycetota bacterium]